MKTTDKIFKYGVMAGLALAMASCAEENIYEPTQAGLPMASDYQIGVTVDDLNNIELNILDKNGEPAKGVFPIWYVNGSTRPSTQLTYRDLITIAGDYPVEMKVGNANGVSEGSQTGTIHVEKTIFDFTPYMRALTDNASKEWTIAGDKQGNMGCGPYGNPTEWWNGGPGAKEAEGVYENILTFTDEGKETSGKYAFDPGTSGTIYVNTGISSLPGLDVNNPNDGNDYNVAVSAMETTFELVPIGANLYLTLPSQTLFPYIPSADGFAKPQYRITGFSKNEITLVQDLEGISWQYIIAPKKAKDPVFTGFKYDSEFNLWKNAEVKLASTFFADQSWGGIDAPEVSVTNEKISFTAPEGMGNDQWQGQVHIATNITLSAAETYDFSMFVDAPADTEITVKPHLEGNDDKFFVADKQKFAADGSCYYFSDLPGFDGLLVLTLDVAGNQGVPFEITNIVIKKHSDNDGTVLPSPSEPEPELPVTWVAVDSEENIFHNCKFTNSFYYAPGWAQIADPEMTAGENSWTLKLPEATSDQWQAQFAFNSDMVTSADKTYDFRVTISSNQDLPGVTFKCVLAGGGDNDNVFYMADRVKVEAYEEVTYKWVNLPGIDMNPMNIVMDFGGNPAGTEVTVKDIIIQEHRD